MKKTIKLSIYSLLLMTLFNINIKAESLPTIQYQTHIQNIGWQEIVSSNTLAGTTGQSLRMEAIKISLTNTDIIGDISYQVHVEDIGWMGPVSSGNLAGTTSQSKRLEAIKISLTGELANSYDIYYQVHAQNYGWLGWAKNGEESGTAGYGLRLEAIKIVIVEKNGPVPGSTENHYYEKPIEVVYQSHVENYGWINSVKNGETSGTTGQSLRVEAINAVVNSTRYSGGISYQTHVQDIGWMNWVSQFQTSGTTGQSKRIEAIKLNLTGQLAEHYDVYYRTHIQNIGWTSWSKNGEASGTTGQSLRMESIEIKLLEKQGDTPTTSNFIWSTNNNVKSLTNTLSGIIGTDVKKIIDVSEHQGLINWNQVKQYGDIDGVILRLGYGSEALDDKLLYNVGELNRLGIPYGLYLFSYAENGPEALSESNFVINTIVSNSLNPTLGIYLDIESWYIDEVHNTNNISVSMYDTIINTFINRLAENSYNSNIYTYLNFANMKLSQSAKTKINWIAQYNSFCQYIGTYKMWQYSSSEFIPGINGRVDMNVWFN